MWRVITLVALLWPSHLSGVLDGAPLDTLVEALLFGLVVPALLWLHPAFLRKAPIRATIIAILLIKIVSALTTQYHGWCLTFDPPRPMVRDSTGKPHSWDLRADWLSDDPECSAIMTRSYRDSFEMPAWFFNLPPPDDAVTRDGFHPGQIPIRAGVAAHVDAIAFYALECLRQAVPEMSWQVARGEGHPYEGLPVLGGHGADLEPIHELIPLAGNVYRRLRPDPQNPRKPPAGEDLLEAGASLVVETLANGPRRFNELRRDIPSVSQRMLTLTLRNLERDGLVSRTVTPTIPPRVDYELTELGHSLQKPISGLANWALENVAAIHGAQARFDAEHDKAQAA